MSQRAHSSRIDVLKQIAMCAVGLMQTYVVVLRLVVQRDVDVNNSFKLATRLGASSGREAIAATQGDQQLIRRTTSSNVSQRQLV